MTQQESSPVNPPPQPKSAGRGIWIALTALVLGIGVGWYLRSGPGPADAANPAGPVDPAASPGTPHIAARSPEEAGRYLVKIGGCNDCHTPGFAMNQGTTPEGDWLIGDQVGFRGPWGTSYPSNLRLYIKDMDEDAWVQTMRQRKARPPMPWPSLNAMSDEDLRAIYRYIKSQGAKGDQAPAFVAPSQEPKAPYIVFEPQMPKSADK